jgi:hypothetical protein
MAIDLNTLPYEGDDHHLPDLNDEPNEGDDRHLPDLNEEPPDELEAAIHLLQEGEVHGLLGDVQVHQAQEVQSDLLEEDEHVVHGIDLNLDPSELQQPNEGNVLY